MGLPTSPQDSAPAYDDVFQDHPVNQYTPSGSSSSYRPVPQDDIELHAGEHSCANEQTSACSAPGQPAESIAQTIAGVFRPKPHTHCEQCDVQTAAREQRQNEKHCCTMTAYVFMIGFVSFMVVGIVAVSEVQKSRRSLHD